MQTAGDGLARGVALTAGPLSAWLAGSDARQVRWAGHEAVARVYVGVRDADWGTVPADVQVVSERRARDAFEVRLAGRNAAPSLAVGWAAVISGSADGVFSYSLVAELQVPSRYNRIGLCVLHRARYLEGSSVTVRQAGGTTAHDVRPTIEPQWCLDGIELGCTEPCDRLEFTTAAGLRVVEEFEGCAFELEDERNFGDGFLKAYGPPLREGYPREAAAGTLIRQQVTVRVSGLEDGPPAGRPAPPGAAARRERRVRAELGSATGAVMPSVGVDYRALPEGLTARSPSQLAAAISPSHLRCEADLRSPGWRREIDAARRLGVAAGVPLEIAVAVDVPSLAALGELAELARQGVARVLLGPVAGGAPTAAHLEAARRAFGAPVAGSAGARRGLDGPDRAVPVFAATAGEVCDLIRDRPRYPGHVGVAFATNPQVHLADDEVIFEGLFGQSAAVRTVAALYPGAAVAVSPVTLRPAGEPGEPPPDDPRLAGMSGAAWAAGSVQTLAAAGAASVTFGLPLAAEGADGGPRPVRYVLAAAAGMSGHALLGIGVDDEGLARAVGVDAGDRGLVLVTNVSPGPVRFEIALPRDVRAGRAWVLDGPGDARRPAGPERGREAGPAGEAGPGGAGPGAGPGGPWRTAGAAGGRSRALPLRLAGYGVALVELRWREGGGMAGHTRKGEMPVSPSLDRPNVVRLSYQHAI